MVELPPIDGVKQLQVSKPVSYILQLIPTPLLSIIAAVEGAVMNSFKYGVSVIFFVLSLLYLFSFNSTILDIVAYVLIAVITVETIMRFFIIQGIRAKMEKMLSAAERVNERSQTSSDKDAYVEGSMARLVYNIPTTLNPYSNDQETKQEEWLSGWVDANLDIIRNPINGVNSTTNHESLDQRAS